MGRWKLQDNIVCMKGTVQCATAEDGDEAEYICDAHNAECAAYEKQIAEMQRRLDAVAQHAAAPNWGDIVCAGGKLELATTRLDEIRAIAEGRDK